MLFASLAVPATAPLPANVQRAMAAVSPDELKGDLSFLSSDALQGRFTPSPGLEVAAEFIASKFRAAGLQPGGNQDYFQVAEMIDRHLPAVTSGLTVGVGDRRFTLPPTAITVEATSQIVHLDQAPVILVPSKDPSLLKGLDLAGKAVVSIDSDSLDASADQMWTHRRQSRAFDQAVANSSCARECHRSQAQAHLLRPTALAFRRSGRRRASILYLSRQRRARKLYPRKQKPAGLSDR